MRLEKHDKPFRIERAGSLKRGSKLRRMMPVIIDDAEICRQVACFESPFRAGKCRKCAGNQRELRATGIGQRDRCQRVEDIVTPGNAELDVAEHLVALGHGEGRRSAQVTHITRREIRIGPAVRNRVCALAAKLARDGILGAIDQGAAGLIRHFCEHLADVIEVAIEIQMLGLDVENHRVLGPIDRERAVAFIALGDHVFAVLRPLGIAAEDRDFRANVVTRLQARFAKNMGGHRRGGRLAVGTRDQHSLTSVQNRRKAFGAAQQGNARGTGSGVGWVFRADRRGINHQVRILHRLGRVRR